MDFFVRNPAKADAYICNLRQHWFCVRPVHGIWWDLNSLLPAPKAVDPGCIADLRRQECTVFVVQGWLPAQPDPNEAKNSSCGSLWTLDEVPLALTSAKTYLPTVAGTEVFYTSFQRVALGKIASLL